MGNGWKSTLANDQIEREAAFSVGCKQSVRPAGLNFMGGQNLWHRAKND
jgi:hypothetical protein